MVYQAAEPQLLASPPEVAIRLEPSIFLAENVDLHMVTNFQVWGARAPRVHMPVRLGLSAPSPKRTLILQIGL